MIIEKVILKNLLTNELYTRKALPFLKDEYFLSGPDRIVFGIVRDFVLQYNSIPSRDSLLSELEKKNNLNEDVHGSCLSTIKSITDDREASDTEWLLNTTEKFCQEKGIYNAITKAIDIMDGKSKEDKGSIPKLLSDALAISFDPNIGHDYFEDYLSRYESYHRVEDKIPFDLNFFNKITNGGFPNGTLNIVIAPTGVGKSLFLCHHAAYCLSMGKNVLYVTLELSEEEVSKRIDANLMNINLTDLMALPKDMYTSRIEKLRSKSAGKLIVKQFPTAGASVTHFQALTNELFLKKSFKPDIIFIDYINICLSARVKLGAGANSYMYIKSIAEELRGFAVTLNLPVVSATQVNRSGYNSSDIGLEDTSESIGLPATADFMFALLPSEELEQLGQITVKQLKNRYGDVNKNRKFIVGIDRSRMKMYDCEEYAQSNIVDTGQEKLVIKRPEDNKGKFRGLMI